ncbi:MAG: hypothetical protein ACM3IJ_03055 [Candidatus Levyibacteriota bacterium]
MDIVENELDSLGLSQKEKEDLMHHVNSSVHYTVLDVILTELPEEHKKVFVHNTRENDHKEIWEHVLQNTVGIEEKIKKKTKELLEEFAQEIRKVKRLKS